VKTPLYAKDLRVFTSISLKTHTPSKNVQVLLRLRLVEHQDLQEVRQHHLRSVLPRAELGCREVPRQLWPEVLWLKRPCKSRGTCKN